MPVKLRLVGSTPVTENGTKRKMPNRRENDRLRGRFHLTEAEVRLLKETALRDNLYGLRDATMISLAFRSCLSASLFFNICQTQRKAGCRCYTWAWCILAQD